MNTIFFSKFITTQNLWPIQFSEHSTVNTKELSRYFADKQPLQAYPITQGKN